MGTEEDIKNLKSRLQESKNWITSNPFAESRKSFEQLINWITAINAGTLFWLAANFDKFSIKDFIPYKTVILFAGLLILISISILISIRAYLYYVQFEHNKFLDFLKFEHDLNAYETASEMLTNTDIFYKKVGDIGKRWSKVDPFVFDKSKILRLGYVSIFIYILGTILIISYIAFFIAVYR